MFFIECIFTRGNFTKDPFTLEHKDLLKEEIESKIPHEKGEIDIYSFMLNAGNKSGSCSILVSSDDYTLSDMEGVIRHWARKNQFDVTLNYRPIVEQQLAACQM